MLAAFGTALPESVVTFVAVVFAATPAAKDIGVGAALGGPLVLATISYGLTGGAILLFRRRRSQGTSERSGTNPSSDPPRTGQIDAGTTHGPASSGLCAIRSGCQSACPGAQSCRSARWLRPETPQTSFNPHSDYANVRLDLFQVTIVMGVRTYAARG